MNYEKLIEAKDNYIEMVTGAIIKKGGLYPHIVLFGDDPMGIEQVGIVHVAIDPKYFSSDEYKEHFVTKIFPEVAEDIKKDFKPYALGYIFEAWVREAKKEQLVDWKELPISKEVVFFNFKTVDDFSCNHIYEIKRTGKKVDENGELVDIIELVELDDYHQAAMEGRFSKLIDCFK